MLNEAKTSRPELRGRGQFLEVEAEVEAKNNSEKSAKIMIDYIRFKVIAGKINNIPEFYTIFARKMPDHRLRGSASPVLTATHHSYGSLA